MDVTAIGEILIDLTQTGVNAAGVPQFSANPGGAPANVAVAAARLGAKSAFWGKVGDDGFGAYLRKVLGSGPGGVIPHCLPRALRSGGGGPMRPRHGQQQDQQQGQWIKTT